MIFLVSWMAMGLMVMFIVISVTLVATQRGRDILKLLLAVPLVLFVLAVLGLFAAIVSARFNSFRAHVNEPATVAEASADYAADGAEGTVTTASHTVADGDDEDAESDTLETLESEYDIDLEADPEAAEIEITIEEERPEWVGVEGRKADGVYQKAVIVGPYSTLEECDENLPAEFARAMAEYVEKDLELGPRAARLVRLPQDYVEQFVVARKPGHTDQWQQWERSRDYSVGRMFERHVLLQFDGKVNAHIRDQWDKVIVKERLAGLGGLAALVLLLLATAYGYLKIDLATKGAYRGRLRLATAAAILAVIAVGLLVTV